MENMDWLEWEPIETPLRFGAIEQHGVFPEQVHTIELSRDEEFNFIVSCQGHGHFNLEEHYKHLQAGNTFVHADETIGRTDSGELISLKGVFIQSCSNSHIESTFTIKAKVTQVEVVSSSHSISIQVEWLANFLVQGHVFTRLTQREFATHFSLQRDGKSIIEIVPEKNEESCLDHFKCECNLNDKKWSFVVGKVTENIVSSKYQAGFLEFEKDIHSELPSDTEKNHIIYALSFALGRPLISLGSTFLDQSRERVQLITKNKNDIFDDNPSQPPTLFGVSKEKMIVDILDEDKISIIISSVASKMEIFENSLWLIWIGLNSPLTVQASFFGAAVESLRNSWIHQESQLSTLLIPKELWRREFKDKLVNQFNDIVSMLSNQEDSINIEDENIKILRNKIESLNEKSSNMKYEEFFNRIGLPVGEVEWRALKERNRSAHGHGYQQSDYNKLPMKMNALYTLYNRIVLKITGASNCYIDYSTYGYPVRDIDEPLGGITGDGQWHN